MGRDDSDQLRIKAARLVQALKRYPHVVDKLDLDTLAVRAATRTAGYRHRLKLPVASSSRGTRIGLRDRTTGRIIHTPDCPVLADGLRTALPSLLRWLDGRRGVHSVDLRVSHATGELQVVFACSGGELDGGARAARGLIREVDGLASVAVSRADKEGKKVMGSGARVIAGKQRLDERIGDTRLSIHAGAFFQVDPDNARQLHELVAAGVGDARKVLDLYAGVGAYGRMLARDAGRRVLAVEEVPSAVRSAQEGAPRNFRVIEGRVEDVLDRRELVDAADVAILNPARRGAVPAVLAAMAQRVGRIVYVSCGPEALARDLDVLAAHGMHPVKVDALDLFPQTAEVETVVVLERGAPLDRWSVKGGAATHPWGRRPSGALGRPRELIVLVIGDPGPAGDLPGGTWKRLGLVAGHGLLSIRLNGPPRPALAALAKFGYPLAGEHGPTRRFFDDKAGLLRPFVHVSKAGSARAALHGDLHAALVALGASPRLLEQAGAAAERPIEGFSSRPATAPAARPRGSGRRGRGRGRRR
jgi:23S rRNA (uracil1939-C5)-methyltransferase